MTEHKEARYRQACVDYVEACLKEEAENEEARRKNPGATMWFSDRLHAWDLVLKAREAWLKGRKATNG